MTVNVKSPLILAFSRKGRRKGRGGGKMTQSMLGTEKI